MINISKNGKKIPCPLCENDRLQTVSKFDRKGKELKTDICLLCGHVFSNPQPTQSELDLFYSKNYRNNYKGVLSPKKKHILRSGIRAIERYKILKEFLSDQKKILDIGSGSGEFLFLLKGKGHQVEGIEPNHGYAEFSKKEYDLNISIEKIENNISINKTWDIICLHHVLEHLSNPIQSLRIISKLLSSEGVLNLEVPNIESRYHSPIRLFHFAHLHNFSKEGLVFALQKANFVIIKIQIMPQTGHINILCRQGYREQTLPNIEIANRIIKHLSYYNYKRDIISSRPYMRLIANIKRPIKEYLKILLLGNPTKSSELLKALYKKYNK